MLEETYSSFKQQAEAIKDWQKMNKNKLINECIEHKDTPLYSAYFAAIVCRYWSNIYKLYHKSYQSVSVNECYNWLIDSILYTLRHKSWLDPNKSLYNDVNGPDKMLNRCIKSSRLIFYQSSNAANRKLNYSTLSVDKLIEDFNDAPFPMVEDSSLASVEDSARFIIEKSFRKKDYFMAFLVNCIAFGDVFDVEKNSDSSVVMNFNKKKLARSLRAMDDKNFISRFSKQYNADIGEVKVAVESCTSLPYWKLNNSINRNLNLLKKELLKINA